MTSLLSVARTLALLGVASLSHATPIQKNEYTSSLSALSPSYVPANEKLASCWAPAGAFQSHYAVNSTIAASLRLTERVPLCQEAVLVDAFAFAGDPIMGVVCIPDQNEKKKHCGSDAGPCCMKAARFESAVANLPTITDSDPELGFDLFKDDQQCWVPSAEFEYTEDDDPSDKGMHSHPDSRLCTSKGEFEAYTFAPIDTQGRVCAKGDTAKNLFCPKTGKGSCCARATLSSFKLTPSLVAD